ncbi:MAG: SIS domain-containing protein [bacterium]
MEKNSLIIRAIKNTIDTKRNILRNGDTICLIDKVAKVMTASLRGGKKVLFCGNGGSAADAQHLAGELSGKFYLDRDPLYAEPLNINTSFITAVANDLSYEEVFSRLVMANGKPGDVLVAISTSGNSLNVIKAIEVANSKKMITVGLTGKTGGKMADICKYLIKVPSIDTPRIQESHVLIGHIICEIVEENIFGGKKNIKTA